MKNVIECESLPDELQRTTRVNMICESLPDELWCKIISYFKSTNEIILISKDFERIILKRTRLLSLNNNAPNNFVDDIIKYQYLQKIILKKGSTVNFNLRSISNLKNLQSISCSRNISYNELSHLSTLINLNTLN